MTFRTASDGTSELLLETPQAKLVMPKMAAFESPVTVAELMSKVIAAAGGEENLRKHSTRLTKFTVQYENQGLTSEGTTRQKAPALKAETEMLSALGKNLDAIASCEWKDGCRRLRREDGQLHRSGSGTAADTGRFLGAFELEIAIPER